MDLSAITDAERVDLIEQAFSSVEEVCSQLDDADWDKPTDCPNWSAKDNLSHLVAYEGIAVGRPQAPADVDISRHAHVANDFQAVNEREVEWRRSRSGAEVLEEFRDVTAERLKQLRELDQSVDVGPAQNPFGVTMPTREFLMIRLLDLFYHEQDIRRAVGKPGHLDGKVARTVFERMVQLALPRVIVKAAGAPEGSIIAFDVEGARDVRIAVRDGRGVPDDSADEPTVRVRTNIQTVLCLFGGRWTPERAREEGRLVVEGDQDLANRILGAMSVVP
ncbi:MAG TPA: DinB family protein [Actinomycetota bacterium]|nr:DinB family protein [Actinomycetota bacterium]